jgi:CheY-specific phosphatase CheX
MRLDEQNAQEAVPDTTVPDAAVPVVPVATVDVPLLCGGEILEAAVSAVLETMFFSAVFGPADPAVPGAGWRAVVTFTGTRAGSVTVCTGDETARALAASFLGADESVPVQQIAGVLGELANMLCGAVLGRIEPDGHFTIEPPSIGGNEGGAEPLAGAGVWRSFELAEGLLAAGVVMV